MRALTILLLLAATGCTTDYGAGGGQSAAPVCYRTFAYQDCETVACGPGMSCQKCKPATKCVPCGNVQDGICWWSSTGQALPRPCVWACPSP
jgi:hypothetical protein